MPERRKSRTAKGSRRAGGSGYPVVEWSQDQRREIADRLLASPFARELQEADAAGVVDDRPTS